MSLKVNEKHNFFLFCMNDFISDHQSEEQISCLNVTIFFYYGIIIFRKIKGAAPGQACQQETKRKRMKFITFFLFLFLYVVIFVFKLRIKTNLGCIYEERLLVRVLGCSWDRGHLKSRINCK